MREHRSVIKDILECVMNYLGNRCNYCGSIKNLHIHHIIPLSKGGQNSLGNLEIVCRDCHLKLHYQIEKVLPKKWIPIIVYCDNCGNKIIRKLKWRKNICNFCQKTSQELKAIRIRKNKK